MLLTLAGRDGDRTRLRHPDDRGRRRLLFFGVGAGGLWLAFIGWFLNMAAQAEAQQVIARERLGGLRVHDLMVEQPVTVEPDVTIGQVIDEVARQHRHSSYPVVEDGRPLGCCPSAAWPRRPAANGTRSMCATACSAGKKCRPSPRASRPRRRSRTWRKASHAAPLVVDDGHLGGLLSLSDLVRAAELAPERTSQRR